MSLFGRLLGTSLGKFQLGKGGPFVKNDSSAVAARNAADAAYAAINASLVNVYGNDVVLNAGASETGGDWQFKLSRPSTGMTHDLQIIWPSGDPSPGQTYSVVSMVGNVITLAWASAGNTADKVTTDTTSLAFGSSSPLTLFTLPANAVVRKVQVAIDTPFNGTPSLSVGISGTTSKYMGATDVDLTGAAGTVYEVVPGLAADSSSEALIATYAAGSASAGAARILVDYVIPD